MTVRLSDPERGAGRANPRIHAGRVAVLSVMGIAIVAIATQLVVGFAFLNWGGSDWGGDLRG